MTAALIFLVCAVAFAAIAWGAAAVAMMLLFRREAARFDEAQQQSLRETRAYRNRPAL
jgi:hypothetical protein